MKVYRKKIKTRIRKVWVNVEPNWALAWELDFKGVDYELQED